MHACMHVCACVCVCMCVRVFVQASVHLHRLSGLAQWVGSVGWRGALWIPLQASSLSGPAKVSLLPGGVGAGGRGGGRFSMTTRHAVSNSNRKGSCTHTLTPRMNFNTNTGTHNKVLIGTYSGKGAACSKPLTLFFTLQIS